MKHHYNLSLLFLFVLFSTSSNAQERDTSIYRLYLSQTYNQEMRPPIDLSGDSFHEASEITDTSVDNTQTPDVDQDLVLAVVFHVLYTDETEKITEQDILEQIEGLNEDFSANSIPANDLNDPDGVFRQFASDAKIRFCRATVDPAGRRTSGIIYKNTMVPSDATDDFIKNAETGSVAWDINRYLNIWIVPLAPHVAGYARQPEFKGDKDGIVINPLFFGVGQTAIAPFDAGKTLTHLAGTYLGLSDLWSDDGCGDDGIDDTPVHNAPNFGVPSVGHISTCDGNAVEMTMNFMDNSDDQELYMFTSGQARRMRSVLLDKELRNSLVIAGGSTQCSEDLTPSASLASSVPMPSVKAESYEVPSSASLVISPNPASDHTVLTLTYGEESSNAVISVYDSRGSLVKTMSVDDRNVGVRNTELVIASWAPGVYLVQAQFDDYSIIQKLVVQ